MDPLDRMKELADRVQVLDDELVRRWTKLAARVAQQETEISDCHGLRRKRLIINSLMGVK